MDSLVAKSLARLTQDRIASAPQSLGLGAPQTAYQFEAQWRALGAQPQAQRQEQEGASAAEEESAWAGPSSREQKLALLRVVEMQRWPVLLKDSLSGPLLHDMVLTLLHSHALRDDPSWAVAFLQALHRVPRFTIASLCLTAPMRAELSKAWREAGAILLQKSLPSDAAATLTSFAESLRLSPTLGTSGTEDGC